MVCNLKSDKAKALVFFSQTTESFHKRICGINSTVHKAHKIFHIMWRYLSSHEGVMLIIILIMTIIIEMPVFVVLSSWLEPSREFTGLI